MKVHNQSGINPRMQMEIIGQKEQKSFMLGLVDVMKNGRLEETVHGCIRVEGKEGLRN